MNFDLTSILLPCVIVAIALVIIGSELIKKLDKKDKLKGYRVYIPAVLSLVCAAVLWIGDFFTLKQVPFYWAVIFAVSVFGYEAILKKIKTAIGTTE